jgi:hypothetical protein
MYKEDKVSSPSLVLLRFWGLFLAIMKPEPKI